MDDPPREITQIIHSLTQSPPTVQRATIERYFTPTASFTHPFCRTGSFEGSRWLIWCIFRWYKILSPRIEIAVESVGFDEENLILYVGIRQVFRIWAVPLPGWVYSGADVRLVTVLRLVREEGLEGFDDDNEEEKKRDGSLREVNDGANGEKGDETARRKSKRGGAGGKGGKLRIQSQNDLYQVNEFVKFVSVFGVLSVGVYAWQLLATLLCVLGAGLGYPISWMEEKGVGGNQERSLTDIVKG